MTPSHVETRENFTAYEESTGEQYRFVLPGSQLHRAEWEAVLDRLASLTAAAEIRGRQRQRAAWRARRFFRARGAAGQGARREDPSSTHRAPALAAALDEGVTVIKPNLVELKEFVAAALETR